jgi:hypothetical protein
VAAITVWQMFGAISIYTISISLIVSALASVLFYRYIKNDLAFNSAGPMSKAAIKLLAALLGVISPLLGAVIASNVVAHVDVKQPAGQKGWEFKDVLDLDRPSAESKCYARSSQRCLDDKHGYWVDSCGIFRGLIVTCGDGQHCALSDNEVECLGLCGNGAVDPGEECDGNTGLPSCNIWGDYAGEVLCTKKCKIDNSGCRSCALEIDARSADGQWSIPDERIPTLDIMKYSECECGKGDAGFQCHTLYRARVDGLYGARVQLSFSKVTEGGPSQDVRYWIVEGGRPDCSELDNFPVISSGWWFKGQPILQETVDIGERMHSLGMPLTSVHVISLFVITGDGAGDVEKKTWFQAGAVDIYMTCKSPSDQ